MFVLSLCGFPGSGKTRLYQSLRRAIPNLIKIDIRNVFDQEMCDVYAPIVSNLMLGRSVIFEHVGGDRYRSTLYPYLRRLWISCYEYELICPSLADNLKNLLKRDEGNVEDDIAFVEANWGKRLNPNADVIISSPEETKHFIQEVQERINGTRD